MDKQQIQTAPARIVYRATPAELLTAIRAELGEGIEPFIFPAEISSNRLDAYYGHMGESTLRNFAADAQAGVSFQDSHSTARLGFGQSLTGTFEISDDIARVVADFYTVPGIEFGGMQSYKSTDDFIKAVKSRLVRDVSVGFYGGDEICDICGESVWDFMEMRCPHIPGIEYPVGEQGKERIVATFTVEDSHLAEVSAVYDGATPEAMILKAERAIAMGELPERAARLLEMRYRIKLPGAKSSGPGVDINKKDKTMTEAKDDKKIETPADPFANIRAILTEAKAPGEPDEGIRWLVTENTRLAGEVKRLQPLADDGAAYRADLIADALAEGVRAMGDDFPEESYRGMLEANPSIEAIKKIRNGFAEQAKKNFPNGRQTVDEDQNAETKRPAPETPDLAYS